MAGRRSSRPDASSWDKISDRAPEDTLSHRDVHESQQLDRGRLNRRRSKKPAIVGALALGLMAALASWVIYSAIAFAVVGIAQGISGAGSDGAAQPASYYYEDTRSGEGGAMETCYRPVGQDGRPAMDCYATVDEVPVPQWYEDALAAAEADRAREAASQPQNTLGTQLVEVTPFKLFLTLGPGALLALIVGSWATRRVDAANLMHDTSDINQHHGDQHIALPEEIQQKFDWFPDAGAHSSVQVSSMISHMMLQKKGLGSVRVVKRATEDVYDADGALVYLKGEAIEDEAGEPVRESRPLIDEELGEALFEASGLPADRRLRKRYDATEIPYNPDGKNRDKLGRYKRVSDLIKDDWELPDYEVARPAGAYLVDTAPVNTMVLAITRAGKGQTYIEPMLDMWSREKRPSNMVVNDPKGELLVKNYVPFVHRGFDVVQFNLINAMKTDIYNPLGMAAEAAREGDSAKCAQYVENIAEVFFPVDGSEDPVWPNAANNAFKRAAYGLIDYYLEEERELREHAAAVGMPPETLERRLDDMWGKVTLYNCYQLFVQLTSKKIKNPEAELERRIRRGEFDDNEELLEAEQQRAESQSALWEGKAEQDMLTLFFNATDALPANSMRTLIGNANNALRAMAGAEKMLASVYGIAITAMSFFADPTISTLTSGKPSQNADLGGLSFPRRLGVRFAPDFLTRDNLIGQQAVWSAYADDMFTENLGPDFEHSEIVSREGWARYYFAGKFPADDAWIKLELINPQTRMLVRTFWFHFRKGYQLSLNGRHYVVEPVTGRKIVKNGSIRELRPVREGGTRDGRILSFEPAPTVFPRRRLDLTRPANPELTQGSAHAITQTMVRYSESPKAVFLVTPPHLMKYAKLILILIKQLVDLNFDKSYMTKSDQKPLYKTRFMLDELGNLQSDGKGISGFETMLSIGLGQDQQFTIILQTLQQLRDVYGESVDKIVQGNTSNIVFLKSTDDAMIETLEKMSGKTHTSYIDSKQISQDLDKVIGGRTEGRVTYTMNTKEEPLISYNDMAFIAERNSIVFRAGDAPVWNRNETILPMAWRLFQDRIEHPGSDYSLQTIPTLSSAMEFDVRANQPDFSRMLEKRMRQAAHAAEAKRVHRESLGYSEADIARLDPDVYADEVMEVVTAMITIAAGADPQEPATFDPDDVAASALFDGDDVVENADVAAELRGRQHEDAEYRQLRYAAGAISREMLVNRDGSAKLKALELEIADAYRAVRVELERDRAHFSVGRDGALLSADAQQVYVTHVHSEAHAAAVRRLNRQVEDQESRVYAEDALSEEDVEQLSSVQVHPAFYRFLASLPSWQALADGRFDRAMAERMART